MANRKTTFGAKVQTKLTKQQTYGGTAFRKKYGGVKGFKGKTLEELNAMSNKEKRAYLKTLNAEANRRLESAARRKSKGRNIGDITEFGSYANRIVPTGKEGEYGFRAYKMYDNMKSSDYVKQIQERQAFLEKKSSTQTGMRQAKNAQKTSLEDTIGRALGKDVTLSEKEAKKWGKLMERLKSDRYLARKYGSNVYYIGTDEIIQSAYAIVNDNKGKSRTVDDLYAELNNTLETAQKEMLEEQRLMEEALKTPVRLV